MESILFYLALSHSIMAAKYKISTFSERTSSKDASTNKWYQLAIGLVMGVLNMSSNTQVASYKDCFPAGFTPANVDDDKSANKNSNWITPILDGLSTLVTFICRFKSQISKLLGPLFRRNFMEIRMRRVKKTVWDTLKRDLGKVKDWVHLEWEKTQAIRDFGQELATDVKDFFSDIKERIISIFPPQFQQFIQKFSDCGGVNAAKKAFGNSVSVVVGIVNKVQKIARAANGDPVAIASLIIGLICKFKVFQQGWNSFKTAWTTTDIPTKYNYYGRAFGAWFNAIATRRN